MFIHLLFGALLGMAPAASMPPTGVYSVSGREVYVGPEDYNGHLYAEYFDPLTRRYGKLRFSLKAPSTTVLEDRFIVSDAQGPVGFSLWRTKGATSKPTIVLIHGADDETRDMGFLIPYFVSHGMNVITFDQRGTGDSSGNWQATGPEEKAQDVLAILRSVRHIPAIDATRIGVWGPSNGGWVAPIIAAHYPLAFMILKSAAAESIESNVSYEIEQVLREHGKFNAAQIASAMQFERTMFSALRTDSNWAQAQNALTSAEREPWYRYMRIPPGLSMPPPAPVLKALQASLEFDPTSTLQGIRVPTLALFGELDKNVDAADSARLMRRDFEKAGLHDFTIRTFPLQITFSNIQPRAISTATPLPTG